MTLDPARVGRDAGRIADEVVTHLVGLVGSNVRVTLEIEAEISKVEQKLANPSFTQKVPPEVLREHEKRLADWQSKKQHIQTALDALEE